MLNVLSNKGLMTHTELQKMQQKHTVIFVAMTSTIVATLDVRLVTLVRMSQVSTIVATKVRVELGPSVDRDLLYGKIKYAS